MTWCGWSGAPRRATRPRCDFDGMGFGHPAGPRGEYGCGLAAAATHLAGSLALTATGMALVHMAMARI